MHGRTRSDRFKGEAEYDTIREICNAVDIPVFANGDIDSPQKAQAVLARTGAVGDVALAAVVSGRGDPVDDVE